MTLDERYPWTAADVGLTFALAIATFLLVPMFAGTDLLGLCLAEGIGLAIVPMLAVRARGLPLATIGLARPPLRAVAGAVLLGLGVWYVSAYLTAPWAELLDDHGEAVEPLEEMVTRTPLAALIALSLVPAVCEEIATRGLLVLGLRPRFGAIAAVVISAAAFALLHVSLVRAVPTAFLGLLLGALVARSGSLVPAMIAHALNNGLALAVATGRLRPIEVAIEDHPHLSLLPALGLVAGGLGIALLKRN